MKKEYIILGGIAAASAAVLLLKKKESDTEFVADIPSTLPVVTNPTPAPIVLNKNLVLKKGSKGNEVRELQKLLSVTVDGDFGVNTEAALVAKKAVKQITLNTYPTTPNVNANALMLNTRVMANIKSGVKVNEVETKADGGMYDTGKVYSTFNYGVEIGTIISISTSKNYYVVNTKNWLGLTVKVWVKATDVAKI